MNTKSETRIYVKPNWARVDHQRFATRAKKKKQQQRLLTFARAKKKKKNECHFKKVNQPTWLLKVGQQTPSCKTF